MKNIRFNERGYCALGKLSKNGDDDNYQRIYAYIARMYGNDKSYSRYFGDS